MAAQQAEHLWDEINLLKDLEAAPTRDAARLKRVMQSQTYPLWTVWHPHDDVAFARVICWFPPDTDAVVVVVPGGDKKTIGDTFGDSVGNRADQIIDRWLHERSTQEGRADENDEGEAHYRVRVRGQRLREG